MPKHFCPLCSTLLEIREVAPCADCGHLSEEIDHFLKHQHTYDEVKLFGRFILVLCDFCQADFPSYDPSYFGLPNNANLEKAANMELLNKVEDTSIQKDFYCPHCQHRLVFLEFVDQCRKINQPT
jgi:hypothetical protein